jgi:caffeoyl-CoA O-methyltransferase
MVTDTVSNDNDRLRVGEEIYCDEFSTSFRQPYKTVMETLYKETENSFRNPHMMVSRAQAKVLHQLVGLLRPSQVLEIGGFTGYSAIAMGSALLPEAKLLSLELDSKHIAVAQRHVNLANLQDKVEFKEGPAADRYTQNAKIKERELVLLTNSMQFN